MEGAQIVASSLTVLGLSSSLWEWLLFFISHLIVMQPWKEKTEHEDHHQHTYRRSKPVYYKKLIEEFVKARKVQRKCQRWVKQCSCEAPSCIGQKGDECSQQVDAKLGSDLLEVQ